jgi:serine/threonine-protein kinase RsbW
MTTEKGPRRIKLIIESKLDNVPLVGTAINKLCSTLALGEVECCEIEICVVEAVNNAVIHAYDREEGHEIEVVFSFYHNRIVIEIKDNGKKNKEFKSPTLEFDPCDRQSLPVGGMGLFIINKVMNKVSYASDGGTNTLTLIKYIDTYKAIEKDAIRHC